MYDLVSLTLCSCAIGALLACGVFISLKILNFLDLTCNGSFVLSGACYIYMVNHGASPIFAMLLCLIIGCICGITTALINACIKAPKILSGLLSMTLFMTIAYNLVDCHESSSPASWLSLAVMLSLMAGLLIAFYKFIVSEFGLQVRAIGGSDTFANTFSFDKKKLTMLGLGISNMFVAFAGVLSVCTLSKIDISSGIGSFLMALVPILIIENNIKTPQRNIYYEFIYVIIAGGIYKCILDLFSISFNGTNFMAETTIFVSLALTCFHFFIKNSNEKNSRDYFWNKKSIYY